MVSEHADGKQNMSHNAKVKDLKEGVIKTDGSEHEHMCGCRKRDTQTATHTHTVGLGISVMEGFRSMETTGWLVSAAEKQIALGPKLLYSTTLTSNTHTHTHTQSQNT